MACVKEATFTHLETGINGHFGRILLTTSPKVAIYPLTPHTDGFLVFFFHCPVLISSISGPQGETYEMCLAAKMQQFFSHEGFDGHFLHGPFNQNHPKPTKQKQTKGKEPSDHQKRGVKEFSKPEGRYKGRWFLFSRIQKLWKFQLAGHNNAGIRSITLQNSIIETWWNDSWLAIWFVFCYF